jgi:predicted dehydrogenase
LASGALGHADLHIPVQGDFEEGFHIAGEFGSVRGRLPLTWYHKSGDVESFSAKDGLYRRPLGADAFTYRLQVESFADVILHGKPQTGANVHDGLASVRAMVAIAQSVETGEAVTLGTVSGGLSA